MQALTAMTVMFLRMTAGVSTSRTSACPVGTTDNVVFAFCSNRDLEEVPADLPRNITVLDLQHNSLPSLDDQLSSTDCPSSGQATCARFPHLERFLLPKYSGEDLDEAGKRYGSSGDELLDMGMQLVEWIHSQPHLPIVKENFYKYCGLNGRVLMRKKMSMERAKDYIDTFYTLKFLTPEYLLNRDPASPQLRDSLQHYYFAVMPTLTDRHTRVYVGQIVDRTFSPHMMVDWHKYMMMLADVIQWDETADGEEVVVDLANLTLQHVATLTPTVIKKLVVCYFKGLPFKPRSIHYINVPSYAEIVLNLVKSLLKPKIADRFFVHTKQGFGTLHELLSPKYLPKDFGGEGPEVKNLHDAWLEKVTSYRDWFLEQDNYVVKEELRPGKQISHSDMFGMEGSFRKLTVD